MNRWRWLVLGVFALLLGGAASGMIWTRDRPALEEGDAKKKSKKNAPAPKQRGVDTQPLLTARSLAFLATTRDEQGFAKQAKRLADHAVDLAFADALRQAADGAEPQTVEMRRLASLKAEREATLRLNQKRVQQLGQRLASAGEDPKAALEDQLEVAKAQLELAQDEFDEAAEDLEQAGGDPQARIRRLRGIYEDAQKDPWVMPAPLPEVQASSFISQGKLWWAQRTKMRRLASARQEALGKVQRLAARREKLALALKQSEPERDTVKRRLQAPGTSPEETQAAVRSLKQFGDTQRRVSDLGRRLMDHQGLAEVYGDWGAVAEGQARRALHDLLRRGVLLLVVVLAVILGGWVIEHVFRVRSEAELRRSRLRFGVILGLRLVGALVLLFMLLGVPSQATTILGLAGAGLTVALKDFIVAFFGWFVLMGRNGLRVGDWVEIKGVAGEVVELGLLHTVLLETGNWNDPGHPTGRRVSFVNSFAIEGHYFNFSTTGQWLWDELRVLVPSGQDPYPILNGLKQLVEERTAASAEAASEEWKKSAKGYRVKRFSADPSINVVFTSLGVELKIRYITRAFERHALQDQLNRDVLELLHGRPEEPRPVS